MNLSCVSGAEVCHHRNYRYANDCRVIRVVDAPPPPPFEIHNHYAIPRENRFCVHYKNIVEDEKHFFNNLIFCNNLIYMFLYILFG